MLNKNHTILNSSGCWASNETQLDDLFNTKLHAVITKTCTLHLKKGNAEPTFYSLGNLHINNHLFCQLPSLFPVLYMGRNNQCQNREFFLSTTLKVNTSLRPN